MSKFDDQYRAQLRVYLYEAAERAYVLFVSCDDFVHQTGEAWDVYQQQRLEDNLSQPEEKPDWPVL